MSITYSTKTKVSAARAVMDAQTYETQKKALDHWGVFNEGYLLGWIPSLESEVEYVERLFADLRAQVTVWYLFHLESRIEDLERGPDPRFFERP